MTTEQQAARSPLTAKLTAWVNRPELRIRISTVFLILALINMPIAMGVFLPAWIVHEPWKFYAVLYFIDFTRNALMICFLLNIITLAANLSKKRWRASGQAAVEILLSVVLLIVLVFG